MTPWQKLATPQIQRMAEDMKIRNWSLKTIAGSHRLIRGHAKVALLLSASAAQPIDARVFRWFGHVAQLGSEQRTGCRWSDCGGAELLSAAESVSSSPG